MDGHRVRGNIVDLVNGAMRNRKMSPPCGYRQFAAALRHAKIPREFIANKEMRHLVADSSDSEVEEDHLLTADEDFISSQETPKRRFSSRESQDQLQKKWRRMSQDFQ